MTTKSKQSVCCATLFLLATASTASTHLSSASALCSSPLLSPSPLLLSHSPTPSTFFSCFIYDTSTSCLEYLPRFIYDSSTQRVSLCECEMRATLFVHWQIIRTIRKRERRKSKSQLLVIKLDRAHAPHTLSHPHLKITLNNPFKN